MPLLVLRNLIPKGGSPVETGGQRPRPLTKGFATWNSRLSRVALEERVGMGHFRACPRPGMDRNSSRYGGVVCKGGLYRTPGGSGRGVAPGQQHIQAGVGEAADITQLDCKPNC